MNFQKLSFVSKRPKWNSNHNLMITHPVLSKLESCDSMRHLKQIQAQMTRTCLGFHHFPFSRLLAFCTLSENGDFKRARLLFSHFDKPNTYMYNIMIRGYTKYGFPNMGISLFLKMLLDHAEMDSRTFVFVLKASENDMKPFGLGVHCMVSKFGYGLSLLVGNGLMHFYVKCRDLDSAWKVFDEMHVRDVISWTTLIDGCSQMEVPNEALKLFYLMRDMKVKPNEVTMISVVSACSQLGSLSLGKSVHEYIESTSINISVNLLNALIDMYGKCGCLSSARQVFDGMESRDVFSWTSMMNVYAKCDELDIARDIFDKMPCRNAISWSCMIAGYSQANQPTKALELFREMISTNVKPMDATLVSVLSACAQNGCLDQGRWIYVHYIQEKRIKLSIKLSNAFVDMYGKCGAIYEAIRFFDAMKERDVVSYNTMITTFAIHGYGKEALAIFEQLKNTGMRPNDITFVGVLSACSHMGLVLEGRKHFRDMREVYNIEPKAAHYACFIDLHGKVGLLEDAYSIIKDMPIEPDEAMWGALLNACKMHGSLELGKCVGEKLLNLNDRDSGTYALLSNIYAAGNKWDNVKKVRMIMKERGVRKSPGCSSIEIEGKIYEFFASDQSHSLTEDIYSILSTLYAYLRWIEMVPETCD